MIANGTSPTAAASTSRRCTTPPGGRIFSQGLVPIVMDGAEFLGLVTRMHVVNFLRRRLS